MLSRRLVCVLASTLLLGPVHAQDEAVANARPNLILIVADDLGVGDVGWLADAAAEQPGLPTPELDRLAAAGVQYRQMRAFPLCSPSRAALMTGLSPIRYGLAWNPIRPWSAQGLPARHPTLAEMLRARGYHTATIGKWHLGHADAAMHPQQRGFDHFYGYLNGVVDHFQHRTRSGGHDWQRNGAPLKELGHVSGLLAAECERLIGAHRFEEQPLFLYLAFSAPHRPLQAPAERIEAVTGISDPQRRVYAAMVTGMDQAVGQVRRALEARGQWDNSLVVFLSDNGADQEYGGNNGAFRGTKGGCGEAGLRVPALAHWPGRIQGGVLDRHRRSILDVAPTLLEAAGGLGDGSASNSGSGLSNGSSKNADVAWDGRSLLAEVTAETQPSLAASGFAANSQGAVHYVIFDGRWKYQQKWVRQISSMAVFLYDLDKDPLEQRNVANSHKNRVRLMHKRLQAWLALEPAADRVAIPEWPAAIPPASWSEPADWALSGASADEE